MLDEANKVVIDLALYNDHVVVGVMEDWVEKLCHFEDIIICWLADDARMNFGCFCKAAF